MALNIRVTEGKVLNTVPSYSISTTTPVKRPGESLIKITPLAKRINLNQAVTDPKYFSSLVNSSELQRPVLQPLPANIKNKSVFYKTVQSEDMSNPNTRSRAKEGKENKPQGETEDTTSPP